MTGKGDFVKQPHRRLRVVLIAQGIWLAVVFLLGAWWTHLALKQAERIAELESKTEMGAALAQEQWMRTQRMLFWESSTYFLLLFVSTGFLLWLYWRDLKRARSLQAFFASVTHELRTPLTSIRLQAESIAENIPASSPDRTLVHRLLEDTLRLESQVERTLELARVEGGGPVYAQPLQIQPWVERFLASWRQSYGDRLTFQVQIDDVMVNADPAAVQVVMKNLLENSIRHSGREKLSILLKTQAAPGAVILLFQDNGEGFQGDPGKLGALFQKGAQSHGAGVGLYLVKVLMERMGGSAQFRPTSGKGFEVHLSFREAQNHG